MLPGLRKDGSVQLPNQWSLKPAGRHLEVGDFPVNVAIHPTGEFAALLCAGYREHEVVVVDLNPDRTRVVSRVQIDQGFYGLVGTDQADVYIEELDPADHTRVRFRDGWERMRTVTDTILPANRRRRGTHAVTRQG